MMNDYDDEQNDSGEEQEEALNVKDSNGTRLADGDSVTVIKDLKVKGGGGMVVKRGTVVKNIRLTSKDDEVDCKVGGSQIVLRTEFLKKA